MTNTIVVVGAGVSGLTSALLLAKSPSNTITVVAKHMPGDYDIEYASPWAGANVSPMAAKADSRWERRTWPELKRLTDEVPEAGIHYQKSHVYRRERDMPQPGQESPLNPIFDPNPWYRDLLPGFRDLSPDELIPGCTSGSEVTSLCINTAIYLPWLLGQCLKAGVVIKRGIISHINEAKHLSHTGGKADCIINTTGLGSLKLGGVQDQKMKPIRGQIVLVRNECTPMITSSGTEDGPTELLYLMQRAGGGGTILGGTYDMGNWESTPDPNIANRIMKRIVEARPEIAGGKGIGGLSVVRHGVGLRPYREGGVRIEGEKMDEETWIVHNYGHSGWGYQGSYGCAEGVVEIVNRLRKEKGEKLEGEPKLFAWDRASKL